MLKRIIERYQTDGERKKIKLAKQISRFETMSNELFMELFEYFDLYSLYITFYSLNSRFNSIIHHCQVHVNLNRVNSLDFTSFIGHFIHLNIPKGRILSLQSSIPSQIAVLVDDRVMDRFSSLRSLTLINCSIDLVIQVLNRIDKTLLEKISISSCKQIRGIRFSLTQQLLSVERYPSLRSINLKFCTHEIAFLNNLEITQNLNRLEYFSLDKICDMEYLFNILRFSPNLRSLNSAVNDSILKTRILTKSLFLSRIKLTSSTIQMLTLEYLLDNCPNLLYLYLDFSSRSSKLIDAQYWMDLFEKIPKLKHVYVRMRIRLLETNLTREEIRQPMKLLKRSWTFKRTLFRRMNTVRVIINGLK